MEKQSHPVRKLALYTASRDPPQSVWALRRRSDQSEFLGRQDLSLRQLRRLSFSTDDYYRKSRAVAAAAKRNHSDPQRVGCLPTLQPEQCSGDDKWRYVPAGYMFDRRLL